MLFISLRTTKLIELYISSEHSQTLPCRATHYKHREVKKLFSEKYKRKYKLALVVSIILEFQYKSVFENAANKRLLIFQDE